MSCGDRWYVGNSSFVLDTQDPPTFKELKKGEHAFKIVMDALVKYGLTPRNLRRIGYRSQSFNVFRRRINSKLVLISSKTRTQVPHIDSCLPSLVVFSIVMIFLGVAFFTT